MKVVRSAELMAEVTVDLMAVKTAACWVVGMVAYLAAELVGKGADLMVELMAVE